MNFVETLAPADVSLGSVEKTAKKVLLEHIVDENNMFRPPVDPYALAEKFGIEVREFDLPSDVSGFIAKEDPDVPAVIYVNDSHSTVRKRFTVAHELGHFIQETVRGQRQFDTLQRRVGHADLGIHEKERWANGFAAAILMPAAPTRRLYIDGESPQEIAERLNVSTTALEYRLANLRLS